MTFLHKNIRHKTKNLDRKRQAKWQGFEPKKMLKFIVITDLLIVEDYILCIAKTTILN